VPLQKRQTCDFSYAGLKTAVRQTIEQQLQGPEAAGLSAAQRAQRRADLAASFQRVAVQHLEQRCTRAIQWARESHPDIQDLVVAGGVASNAYLRSRLQSVTSAAGLGLVCPPPKLCTDNGVMVAWAGQERLTLGLGIEPPPSSPTLGEDEWLDLRPRWPLTDRKDERSFTAERSAKKKNVFASLEALTAGSIAASCL